MKDILFNKKILLLIVPAILILVWLFWPSAKQASYQTKKVERGNITLSVMATGSLEPVNQVDVGTEVSGTVRKVFVDYNDRVKAGQLLAVLDTQKLEATVVQSRSVMESSRATVDQAYAAVEESRQNLARLEKLFEVSAGRAPSQQDLEASRATLRKSEASYRSAIAQVRESEARLKLDQVNLQKASIRSPINGIVLSRVVEPGQTVAASLQTPTLFTIAETLTQLRLIVAVDEADIGMVKKGQEASFTVDAYPDRTFPASIEQVRYASEITDNVVTYQTVLAVGNGDLALRPGMTATAVIVVDRRENVVVVPAAALRFQPTSANQSEEKSNRGGLLGMLFKPPGRDAKPRPERSSDKPAVYLLRDGQLIKRDIKVGLSDGVQTEVLSGLNPGDVVVVSEEIRHE